MTGAIRVPLAYVCDKCFEKDGVRRREFRRPGQKGVPECPKHGKMTRERRKKYRGTRP